MLSMPNPVCVDHSGAPPSSYRHNPYSWGSSTTPSSIRGVCTLLDRCGSTGSSDVASEAGDTDRSPSPAFSTPTATSITPPPTPRVQQQCRSQQQHAAAAMAPITRYALVQFKFVAGYCVAPFRVTSGDAVVVEDTTTCAHHIGIVRSVVTDIDGLLPHRRRLVRHARVPDRRAKTDDVALLDRNTMRLVSDRPLLPTLVGDVEWSLDGHSVTVLMMIDGGNHHHHSSAAAQFVQREMESIARALSDRYVSTPPSVVCVQRC